MNCNEYKKFHLGKITEEEFNVHEKICSTCRMQNRQDEQLLLEARKLKVPLHTQQLWAKIESRLQQVMDRENADQKRVLKVKIPIKFDILLKAAVFVVGICLLALFFLNILQKQSSGLLTQKALKKVEKTEQAYIEAISEMENQVDSRLGIMDVELSFLYRDRLDTINEQIRQCKVALKRNPANNHVRRYLLAALKDKKETLREIIAFQPAHT